MPTSDPLLSFAAIFFSAISGLLICSLIGAILLRLAAQIVSRIDIPFDKAFVTTIITGIIIASIKLPIAFGLRKSGVDSGIFQIISLGLVPVWVYLEATVISVRHDLSFSTGLKISLLVFLIPSVIIGLIMGFSLAVNYFVSPY